MGTALVLGGTGQIGIPAAQRLAEDGWDVTVAGRSEAADVRFDRTVPGELEAAVDGFDVLVDVIPFTNADALQLASLAGRVGSLIAISSAASMAMAARKIHSRCPSPRTTRPSHQATLTTPAANVRSSSSSKKQSCRRQ